MGYQQYDLANATYMGGPLLEGWEACRSRTTGRMYYVNRETGETQWEVPEAPLHPHWVEKKSPATGASKYVHKDTGQTTWSRPLDEDAYWKQVLGAPVGDGDGEVETPAIGDPATMRNDALPVENRTSTVAIADQPSQQGGTSQQLALPAP